MKGKTRRNFIKPRTIRKVLVVLMMIMILMPSTSTVTGIIAYAQDTESNSNDKRQDLINLGRGLQSGEGVTGFESLSGEQLKTLGVFLSNYYVPFSTQISGERSDEEAKENKEKLVEVLTETGSFNETDAGLIVDAVLGASKKPQKLYIGWSTDGGTSINASKGSNGDKGRPAKFYEFLDLVMGNTFKRTRTEHFDDSKNPTPTHGENIVEVYPSMKDYIGKDGKLSKSEKKKKYEEFVSKSDEIPFGVYNMREYGWEPFKSNRGVLYWGDGGSADKSKVVFDFIPDTDMPDVGQTASQTIMSIIYSYLDSENSVGTAFLDYSEEDRGDSSKGSTGSGKTAGDLMKDFMENNSMKGESIEEMYKRSMYDWELYVDVFGNIIVDTGVSQYVMLPAAMNPYVFKKDGDTEKDGKLSYGRSVPFNNLISLTLAGQGKLLKDGGTVSQTEAQLDIDNIYDMFPESSRHDGYRAFVKFPGTNETNWNEGWGKDWGAVTLDMLTSQYAMNEFRVKPKSSDWGEYLKWGDKPKNSQRFTNANDFLEVMFRYGFNSSEIAGNAPEHIVQVPKSAINTKPSHYIIQDLISIDGLGLLTVEDYEGNEVTPESLMRGQIWDSSGTPTISLDSLDEEGAFGKKLDPDRSAINLAKNNITRDFTANIYLTYVMAGLGGESVVGFKIGHDNFPTYNQDTMMSDLDTDEQFRANTNEVMNLAYYFLHPTEGIEYIKRWFKTKVGAVLVGWHNDMVGSSNSQVNSGMTKYLGFSGFTTMPSLNDMEWTSWMVNNYLDWGLYIIIGVMAIMVLYIALGDLTIQKAFVGIALFVFCLYIPPIAINSTVGVTNAVSDAIYSNKFTYWGIMQLQSYQGKVDELAEVGTSDDSAPEDKELNYANKMLGLQNGSDGLYANNQSLGNGVTLKWMAPKKDNYLAQIQDELESKTTINDSMLALTGGLLRQSLSGETYIESSDALYLYRTFQDISNYSRFYYGNLMGDSVYNTGSNVSHDVSDAKASLQKMGLGDMYNNYMLSGGKEGSLNFRKEKGFINDAQDSISGGSVTKEKLKRLYAPLSSIAVANASVVNLRSVSINNNVGLSSDALKATVRNFNIKAEPMKHQLNSSYSSEELASVASFALYTESPYYYFSWFLYDNGMSTKSGGSEHFKEMLLPENKKDDFFFNYTAKEGESGYGELKDYMDMGSLFHSVIPYMKKANDPISQWSAIRSTKPYPGYPTDEDTAKKMLANPDENSEKVWHNMNLARVFNLYTPWVDAMYDSKYADPQTIEYGGEKETVEDPIDPRSYTIRPMIFSESEMAYYGLKDYNLTEVERKILKVQKDTREDLIQLLNYNNFDEPVLNSVAAMTMTFNFNKEFSQNNFFNESFVQYPQGFELKNFTYDAYLRLMLAESTGEDLADTSSVSNLYERVVERSNIGVGILLVLGDFLAVYGVPVMKFLFLIAIFVLSVMAIFVKAVRSEIGLGSVLWSSLAKPLLQFCLLTLAHSYIISLFMSNGATGVTGDLSTTIALGDPAMTLIMVTLLNGLVLALYGFIMWGLIKQLINYGKLSYGVVSGLVSSVSSAVTGVFRGATNKVTGGYLGGQTYSSGNSATSSTYSTNPKERGKNNTEPENTVEADLRTKDVNRQLYDRATEELDKGREQTASTLNEAIEKGREKVNSQEDYIYNNNDIKARGSNGDTTSNSFDSDAEEDRKNIFKTDNDKDESYSSDPVENREKQEKKDRKKNAEDIKNKYNLD